MHRVVTRFLASVAVLGVLVCTPISAQQVDMSPDQRERLKTFGTTARDESGGLRAQLRHSRFDLMKLYRSYTLDKPAAEAALANIEKAQLGLLRLHLRSQKQLRRMLTEDQFNGFRGRMGHVRPNRPNRTGERRPDRFGMEALEKLQLTPDQERQLQGLDALRDQSRRAGETVLDGTKDLMEMYSKYDLDERAANRTVGRIHRGQMQLSRVVHRHELLLRSVLSEQQFLQFRSPWNPGDKRPRWRRDRVDRS